MNTPYDLISLSRLLTRTEDLAHLMNDEVTDINQILKVINTIQVGTWDQCRFVYNTQFFQVDKNLPELKSKQFL